MSGLYDIPAPDSLLPGLALPWWIWFVVGAFLAGSAYALLKWLSRHPSTASYSDNCFRDSCEALEKFNPVLGELPLAEVATKTSLILRNYLALTLEDSALYETHEEFLLRADSLQNIPRGARERLAPLLSELASAKYGPSRIDPAASKQIIDNSLRTLHGLESTRGCHVA